jgi:hypothetical protein
MYREVLEVSAKKSSRYAVIFVSTQISPLELTRLTIQVQIATFLAMKLLLFVIASK